MSDDERRRILQAVADGRMDPGDAADALAELDESTSGASEPNPPSDAPEVVSHCTSIKVDGSFRSIEVIGDDGVHEAIAEGPHRVRWEGDVLVIDAGIAADDDVEREDDDYRPQFGEWFRTSTARGAGGHAARMAYRRGHREFTNPLPLRVRVNPSLPLDLLRELLLGQNQPAWRNPAVPLLLQSEPRPEYAESARATLASWALGCEYYAHPDLRAHLTRIAQTRNLATAVALWGQVPAKQLPAGEHDALAFARHLASLFGLPWPEEAP